MSFTLQPHQEETIPKNPITLTNNEIIQEALEGNPDYEAIGKIMKLALVNHDAITYATCVDILGIQGEESADPLLYQSATGRIRPNCEKDLEVIVTSDQPTLDPELRIRKRDLETLDYRILETIYHGIHNLTIPTEMRNALNPAEQIALYYAAQRMKYDNQHQGVNFTFQELIANMNAHAYPYLHPFAETAPTKYSTKPGEQKKRLSALDNSVKERFMESFNQRYRYSNAERASDYNYADPDCDGHNKKVYINSISKLLGK